MCWRRSLRCTAGLLQVLFDFRWLHAKLSCMSLHSVLADYDDCVSFYADLEPAVPLLMDAFRLSASVLGHAADMLGPQIAGRLLPYYKSHARIRHFRESLTY